MSVDKQELVDNIKNYYENAGRDENSRYKSWEHCYKCFYDIIKNGKRIESDILALNLAFYLASWGMYRGSSFLLQQDYKIHIRAIDIILDKKYGVLFGINCDDLNSENISLMLQLKESLNEHYNKIKKKVIDLGLIKESKNDITDTLISKILLGTFGCIPAYDRYFKNSAKQLNIEQTFTKKSINGLCRLYEKHKIDLETIRNNIQIGNIKYPQMKIIDMAFFQMGLEYSKKSK